MNQTGQNQGLTFDQMKEMAKIKNQYQIDQWNRQQANRPWVQKNPGTAMAGGAGLAALTGLASGLFGGGGLFGKSEKTNQVPLYSKEIMGLKNMMPIQLWQQIMGDQFDFGPIENLARRGFESKTLPSIMNRFNMGNNLNSSSMQGAITGAGGMLDAQLAAMRQNYGQERQRLLASLMPTALSPSFENVTSERKPGGAEQGMQMLMQLLPYLAMAA